MANVPLDGMREDWPRLRAWLTGAHAHVANADLPWPGEPLARIMRRYAETLPPPRR
jgi:hypothetical protein